MFAHLLAVVFAVSAPYEFPAVRAVPLPGRGVSFTVHGEEIARFGYDVDLERPYLYPLRGPAGHPVTRMGHPADPEGHGHHRSVWTGHMDVNGLNFWEDGPARVTHGRVAELRDGTDAATAVVELVWRDADGRSVLNEERTMILRPLADGGRYLDLRLVYTPAGGEVEFGKTPFGFLGVRVESTVSVRFGGGRVLNSEGGVDEEGTRWQRARWVDYTGPVAPGVNNGISVFDHPSNPRHPTYWHVRNDGWMGASFCYDAPHTLGAGESLVLRYRLFVHGEDADAATLDRHWREFAGE